jgi:putative ABC transport system permease protein
MFFLWIYLNEKMVDRRKDQVGIIVIKVADASQSTAVAAAVDKAFANSVAETRTESEKAFQLEFISMASQIIGAIQIVSLVVLIILMLILGNTLAMATRERTTEYAVMRAIGFKPWHIVRLVLGEGFVIALVGVLLGVAMAPPIMHAFGDFLEKQMGGFISNFDLAWSTVGLAVGVALALGMLASAIPAARAGGLKIVDALRRIE